MTQSELPLRTSCSWSDEARVRREVTNLQVVIHLAARRVCPDHRDRLVSWLREIDGPRRGEALESLDAEGVDHETAMIIETSDGPLLIYAMQTDDLVRSRAVSDESKRSVDVQHRAVTRAADDGPADAEIVLDLRADQR